MSDKAFLELRQISKSFPGVKALDDMSIEFRCGEIHCLCGENGAGKSTLIKIMAGAYTPDTGEILVEGKSYDTLTPRGAMDLGIQTIYQEHTIFPDLSVTENLFIGREVLKNGKVVLNHKEMEAKAQEILEYLHSDIKTNTIVRNLNSGKQKIVEIAKGLLLQSKIIILDEPTASFSQKEISNLFEIIEKLKRDGVGIVYISHHLDEVFRIADKVTVIRDGKKISTHGIEGLTEEMITRDMIGRDISTFYIRESFYDSSRGSEMALECNNISAHDVNECSFYVRKGELLGIAGMVGSGRTELVEIVFGARKMVTGEIKINGEKVDIKSPKDAILNHICFITEDRQNTGLFLTHTLVQNTVVAKYTKEKSWIAPPSQEVEETKGYIERLNIVTPSPFQRAVKLSGGNQQKVILAKWFLTQGDIFIFDEPTRGIDVGAKEEIYSLISELLEEGKAIIMVSSDMAELIALSDRVNIMRGRSIVAELSHRDEITEENILKYSIGQNRNEGRVG